MATSPQTDLRWWQNRTPHMAIGHAIQRLDGFHSQQRAEDELHLRLYSEREWALYRASDPRAQVRASYRARKRKRLSLNVVRNCIDSWVSLLGRNRPHITFLTKGADWDLQKKARLRTRFVEALFHGNKAYALANRVRKHAGIFARGYVHVVKAHGRIGYDACMPGEIVYDPHECQANDPRQIHRVRSIDKLMAKELWPNHAREIERAQGIGGSDRVPFVDSWHLPSGPKAGDGMHIQCIPNVVTLRKRPYQWESFPIVSLAFDDAPIGWQGQGIAEELAGIQYEINVVLRTIQANCWSGGNLKVAVHRGSNVGPSSLSNMLGVPVIEFTGQRPEFFANDIASQQLFAYLESLVRKAYDIIGVSQMQAEQTTPFASMSGRARLVTNHSYSQRFVTHQHRDEEFFRDLAERSLEAAADLAEDDQDVEVIFPGREHLEVVKYSDIAGEHYDFDCQAWTTSLAGEGVAAQLANIEQMMGLGMIDLAGAMLLFEVPHDMRAYMESVLAPIELAREAIDMMIGDGIPVTPTPMMDLAYCSKQSQLWYQRGVLRGVADKHPERLYMLLDFHKMAMVQLLRAQAANSNAGAPPELAGKMAPAALPAA